jgi:Protein tyrosine and serine/threonine kinase
MPPSRKAVRRWAPVVLLLAVAFSPCLSRAQATTGLSTGSTTGAATTAVATTGVATTGDATNSTTGASTPATTGVATTGSTTGAATTGAATTGAATTGTAAQATTGSPPDSNTSSEAGVLGFPIWQVGVAAGVIVLILVGIIVGIVVCVKKRNKENISWSMDDIDGVEDDAPQFDPNGGSTPSSFGATPSIADGERGSPMPAPEDVPPPPDDVPPPPAAPAGEMMNIPPPLVPGKKKASAPSREWEIDASELQFGEQVGIGSFGTVYKGQWRDQVVAIKVIRGKDGSFNAEDLDEKHVEEFSSEAKVMTQIPMHENVCRLLAVTTDPFVGLVLEYMAHGNAHEYMKAYGRFERDTACHIMRGMSVGLAHLHQHEIVQ